MPSKPQLGKLRQDMGGRQTGKQRIFLLRHRVIEGAVISGSKPKQASLDDDQTEVEVNMPAAHVHPVYDSDKG